LPWREAKSRNVGFMGTRDVGEEEVCRGMCHGRGLKPNLFQFVYGPTKVVP